MSAVLAKHVSTRVTPQSEPIPGSNQQQNNAGGFSHALDKWGRLWRFLILGSAGGTYYVKERALTQANAKVVVDCADEDPLRTIALVVEVSEANKAPKNDPAIFALALLASHPSAGVRRLALEAMPRVCRIPTHLFSFIANCKELRGWGRGLRQAVADWYNNKPLEKLAYQVTKYRNRGGYSHRDALRLSHPKAIDMGHNALYHWLTQGTMPDGFVSSELRAVYGFEKLNSPGLEEAFAIDLIQDYELTLEHVPNTLLGRPAIWEALLPHLPSTALIRNLGKMTSVGFIKPLSAGSKYVCEFLHNVDRLKAARVHPFGLLNALKTYGSGHGFRGTLTWQPDQQVCAALEDAFYASFDLVVPTGKNHLLALDVSGSMCGSHLADSNIDAREASACMAMVTNRVEPNTHMVAFSTRLQPFPMTRNASLSDVTRAMSRISFGGTDCSLPMIYAKDNKLEVDTFVVYTDSETWAGRIHPCQALKQYRQASGRDAKLIVVGMTATEFTIADPTDAGMLDVVGFDSSCPALMAEFTR
jgi:60 kDa SS-A/Ro ribonucleoprotein